MLRIFLLSLIILSSSNAYSSMRDGCFAMIRGSATNGVLCISGVNEESLSGEGTRFMFFSSGSAKWCGMTSSLKSRFGKDGSSVVRFSFPKSSGIAYFLVTFPSAKNKGAAEGKIRMVGAKKTDFDYVQISSRTIENAGIAKAWKSAKCREGFASSARRVSKSTSGWMSVADLFRMGGVPMGAKVEFKLKNGTTVSGLMMPILSRDSLSIKVKSKYKDIPVSSIEGIRFI